MKFNEEARLRIQVSDQGLTIIAAPRKGEPGEEVALQAIEHIANELSKQRVVFRRFERNTENGRHVDMISTALREAHYGDDIY